MLLKTIELQLNDNSFYFKLEKKATKVECNLFIWVKHT